MKCSNKVLEYFRKQFELNPNLCKTTAIRDKGFLDFFRDHKIDTAVEIGTFQGMSSAYIACFVEKIYTFDIKNYRTKYKSWKDLGVDNKIFSFIINVREDIKKILDKIKFDFAFIDGSHLYEDVKSDFDLVKQCGRVLFHDVENHPEGLHDGVRKFIGELGNVKIIGNVGYWEKCETHKNL